MLLIETGKNLIFEFTFERKYHNSFYHRLYALITSCSFYYLQDNEKHFRPDEVPDFTLEYSYIKRLKRRVSIWKELDAAYGLKRLEESYTLFEDDRSKKMFLLRILNNVYDDRRLARFPLFYSRQYDELGKLELVADKSETINLWNGLLNFMKFPLQTIGMDLTLWGSANGIFVEFILDQYRYKDIVYIKDGDNVLDGGACYGDTALHFATQTSGKIYSFEFIRENIEMFKKNIELNPKYQARITIVERPLCDVSGQKLYAVFNGPGTTVAREKEDSAVEFSSITIDDFVNEQNIESIDFIKLDIEGSEEKALKGAAGTIKKFKPKLAICAYHKKDDLIILPILIKNLLPDYSLYLDHHTIKNNETVIYATCEAESA